MRHKTEQEEIAERIAHIEGQQNKVSALMGMLKRSLAIQDIWPDAFEHGKCNGHVQGNPHHPSEMVYVIIRGDGERREFRLLDTPVILWEHHVEEWISVAPRAWRHWYAKRKRDNS